MSGGRRPAQQTVAKEPSRVARWAAAVKGPEGVTLDAELDRFDLPAAPGAGSSSNDGRDRPAA
jgi:hypothetical protein